MISAIDDDRVAVAPMVDWQRLEYLRLLEYGRCCRPKRCRSARGLRAAAAAAGCGARRSEAMTRHLAARPRCAAARAAAAGNRAARGARSTCCRCRPAAPPAPRRSRRCASLFFWSLYRPDLFGAGAAFAIGLAHDALAGLPLGLTSLVLLLVRHLVVVQQRFFARPLVPGHLVLLPAAGAAPRWRCAGCWPACGGARLFAAPADDLPAAR